MTRHGSDSRPRMVAGNGPAQVRVVPLGAVADDDVGRLVAQLRTVGFAAVPAVARPIPAGCYDAGRRQFRGDRLLEGLCRLPGEFVLGVINEDMYVPPLRFVFGVAQLPGRCCLVSLTRLRSGTNCRGLGARALKEAVHELGHSFGLHHCPDPRCVMYFSHTLADTDRKGHRYCRQCQDRLRSG